MCAVLTMLTGPAGPRRPAALLSRTSSDTPHHSKLCQTYRVCIKSFSGCAATVVGFICRRRESRPKIAGPLQTGLLEALHTAVCQLKQLVCHWNKDYSLYTYTWRLLTLQPRNGFDDLVLACLPLGHFPLQERAVQNRVLRVTSSCPGVVGPDSSGTGGNV